MESIERSINVGILTISDTRTSSSSNSETFDFSGHNLKELINNYDIIKSANVVEFDCVTDDFEKIQAKMAEWCTNEKIHLLLSIGGTGFSPRDVTPEATLGLITKLTPGISQAIMNESLKITPMAMLSRAVSGIYKKTLIVNLPGSKDASEQCLRIIKNAIPHAISLIRDEKDISKQFHNQFNPKINNESKVPESILKIACRHRESPYPKICMKTALNILKEQSFLQYTESNKIMYPTVCIFSTGDELISKNDSHHGYIRDTNSVMIEQILEQDKYMGKILNYGVVRDNWNDLCKQFEKAFNNADIVVTSGGVSMGEKDFIKHVLKEHFKSHIHFGRLNMKPGMPTTFVTLHFNDKKKYVFCLPGNPVSAGVCTHLILLPFLRSVSGRKSITHSFQAIITHDVTNLDTRPEYKRALLKYENGEFLVSCLTYQQQSSRLLSFVGSNCLLQLPSSMKQTKIDAKTIMNVILIKSIENTYVASILKEKILEVKVHTATIFLDKKDYFDNRQSIQNVLDLIAEHASICVIENIPIETAMGHVLHLPVYSTENLPNFRASIKDGYAIKYIDSDYWCNVYKVVQVSVAGTNPDCQEEINENECSRISTGAPLPPGANCVVQVEDTSIITKSPDGTVELTIAVLQKPKPLDNIRNIGSDISISELLLDSNTEIGPFEIALLRSVGCEQVFVYKHPTIHIIPHINNCSYRTSSLIKNMLKRDGFKGNVSTHTLWEKFEDFFKKYGDSLYNNDTIVICSHAEQRNLHFDSMFEFDLHFYVHNEDREISFGFGVLRVSGVQLIMFHITCHDWDSIYNCVHLFILPFLRLASSKKQHISSIRTKLTNAIGLPSNTFVKAELNYDEDGDFNVTCFPLNQQNCIVDLPQSTEENDISDSKTEVDVIITENSDSYFIQY